MIADHPDLARDDFDGILHVARHMREWDRREIFATRWSDEPEGVVASVQAGRGPSWVARYRGEPAAACGIMALWPGVWAPWCFGTDKFPRVARLLTRLGKEAIMPAVRNANGHRLEVKSMDGHTDAHRWLEVCFGAEREATHPGYGRNGETFHTYVVRL